MSDTSGTQVIQPPGHTLPIGKYSPAVSVPLGNGRRMVFVSGQVSSDAEGTVIGPGDATVQTETVFRLLSEVLKKAGGELADLVSVVIYLSDMADFAAVSAVRNRVLSDPAPSSTLVEVSRLAIAEHLVEISGVAVVEERR
ncbi:RidA family protein [Streptomyces poriferorum]|uniref:RidA family protein n=1 Tax=Streptomyces poriferorum TaxID=2798799 RepID=A0ABY9IG99_9ACTN|nr:MULTISPECIES: RidA family protein [Streptomyces]MBW5248087.1 RidA family protein [Streptomyces poriferorum]MBW5255155.1 RidA family protein [Streptomyces poriferorum]MDP5315754.1 RidA family protein [Streptomyces sp. Alt4]WLQ53124.1 RidA family protein [Streptomyces sp. Alt1]WLQ54115.1 RidA family protein [Streptomyces sp. Alt2]